MIMVAAQALVAVSSRGRNCEPPKVANTRPWKRRFSMSVLASTSRLCRPVQRLRMKDERGFALIMVLLVLALVAVVSAEFAYSMRLEAAAVRGYKSARAGDPRLHIVRLAGAPSGIRIAFLRVQEGNSNELLGLGRGRHRVHGTGRRAPSLPLQSAALATRAARGAGAGLLLPHVRRERDDPVLRPVSNPGRRRSLLALLLPPSRIEQIAEPVPRAAHDERREREHDPRLDVRRHGPDFSSLPSMAYDPLPGS